VAPPLPPREDIEETVRRALAEDVGQGDITTALVSESTHAEATVIGRQRAVLCGTAWFETVFEQLDPRIRIQWKARDGDTLLPEQILCVIAGPAQPLLTGERTALNFLQTLAGTASIARRYADAVQGTGARILDTRKTLPGLRSAQKYAVRCGGCHNHRMGLYDSALIKENHILAAGSINRAVERARAANAHAVVEVEVESLEELGLALKAGADIILLDNFSEQALREAVRLTAGCAKLEASGGITLENVRRIAETGVDYISIGTLTKDLSAIDLSMRIVSLPLVPTG
jgi:nicotinate-nucleotide pyrophosphorylase